MEQCVLEHDNIYFVRLIYVYIKENRGKGTAG